VVEDVEELSAKLESRAFADLCRFQQARIQIEQARTNEALSCKIAQRAEGLL
jgi:hypothetical protein